MTVKQADRIVIFNGSTQYEFDHNHIKSVTIENTVSILGSELSYDTAEIDLFAVDDYNFTDIRDLPFATPLVIYNRDGEVRERYYIDKIKRPNRTTWSFSCISAIGILERKEHHGALYKGESVSTVLHEIIGDSFIYSCVNEVGEVKVYGWLPYAKARDNLRQLLFTYNIHIDKDGLGNVVFTRMANQSTALTIDDRRIYIEGEEENQSPVTKVIVAEHIYDYRTHQTQNYADDEYTTIFDNTEDLYAEHKLVKFSEAPIWVDSIKNDNEEGEENAVEIEEVNENYAIVTGRGKLVGVPYNHRTIDIERTGNPAEAEREVSVTDATLVNILNVENIADRLMDYYSVKQKVTASLIFNGETPGKRYRFLNTFGELTTGYLSRCSRSFTSRYMGKASCDFIVNYIGDYFGNNYENYVVLKGTGVGTWSVPAGVSRFTAVLVGGGDGGDSGLAGQPSSDTRGGTGGSGGADGKGGYIYQVTVNNPASVYEYRCGLGGAGGMACVSSDEDLRNKGLGGTHTYFRPSGSSQWQYSSMLGAQYDRGFLNPITGIKYGSCNALEGIHGGDGGTATADWADNGGFSYYEHYPEKKLRPGGKAAWSNVSNDQKQIMYAVDVNDTSTPPKVYGRVSGGGGGGAGSALIPGELSQGFQTDADNGVWPWINRVEHKDDSNDYIEFELQPGAGGNGARGGDGGPGAFQGGGGLGGGGGGGAGGMGVATTEDFTREEERTKVIDPGDPEEEREPEVETKKITVGGKSTRAENPLYGDIHLFDNMTIAEIKQLNPADPNINRSWDGDVLNFNGLSYIFNFGQRVEEVDEVVNGETQKRKIYHSFLASIRVVRVGAPPLSQYGSSCIIKGGFTLNNSAVLSGCPSSIGGREKSSLYAYRDSATYNPYLYEDFGGSVGLPAGPYSMLAIGFNNEFIASNPFENIQFNLEVKGGAIGGYGGAGGKGADGCIIVFY